MGSNGWNRSSGNSENTEKKAAPRPWRGLVAGALVVLVAAVVAWWLWPTGENAGETSAPQTKQRIKEVTPAAAPKAEPVEEEKDPPGYYKGKKISDDNRPPWMSPYHRIVDYGPIQTNKISASQIPFEERVFEEGVDQQIAGMLLVEPGTGFLGDCNGLYDGFDKDFLESLKVPIIVRQDDPEEVKAIKRAVIEVKADLKARMDAGENLQKIMEDNWREMKELGLYRQELDEQLDQICAEDDSITEQDLDDYVAAANKMLTERGCAEMRTPLFLKEKVRMRAERRIRERETNAKQEE